MEVEETTRSYPPAVVPTEPSIRINVVLDPSASAAFPLNRNHAAVPVAIAVPDQSAPETMEITPVDSSPKTSPFAWEPSVKVNPSRVMRHSFVPFGASSGEVGCVPE